MIVAIVKEIQGMPGEGMGGFLLTSTRSGCRTSVGDKIMSTGADNTMKSDSQLRSITFCISKLTN